MRAVVTGASAGVGAAFARALSARGYAVVLVGRDRGRLDAVADALPGPSEIVTADLARADGVRRVAALLAAEPADLLVNNAAAGVHGVFAEQDPAALGDVVALNAAAVVALTRAALGPMLARRRGGVIAMSSLAAGSPQPGMATYAATKAFVELWAASVQDELRGTGVTLTCVRPGWVRTGFHARSGQAVGHVGEADWLDPDDVAVRALDAHARGRASVVLLPALPPVRRAARAVRSTLGRVKWLRSVRRSLPSG